MRDIVKEVEGRTIADIKGLEQHSDEVRLVLDDGRELIFYHCPDCCEMVSLADFEDDGIIGGAIFDIEEVIDASETDKPREYAESWTWCFYKVETTNGGLWMRWLGESNGYYSEQVEVLIIEPD